MTVRVRHDSDADRAAKPSQPPAQELGLAAQPASLHRSIEPRIPPLMGLYPGYPAYRLNATG